MNVGRHGGRKEGQLSLGDEWRCRTADTSMAGTEWIDNLGWKHRRQSEKHRCLDATRCKDGESSGEHGQDGWKILCAWLLERSHSKKHKIRVAVVEELYCACRILERDHRNSAFEKWV